MNLHTKVIRLLYQGPRTSDNGTYYCYLGQVVSGDISLGVDPEQAADKQSLHEVRWFPMEAVQDHMEVARILPKLQSH